MGTFWASDEETTLCTHCNKEIYFSRYDPRWFHTSNGWLHCYQRSMNLRINDYVATPISKQDVNTPFGIVTIRT